MTAQGLAAMAAMQHGVKPSDILSKRRYPEVVKARHHAWRIAREAGWTLARIGREFGVDHTTVMAALR